MSTPIFNLNRDEIKENLEEGIELTKNLDEYTSISQNKVLESITQIVMKEV